MCVERRRVRCVCGEGERGEGGGEGDLDTKTFFAFSQISALNLKKSAV